MREAQPTASRDAAQTIWTSNIDDQSETPEGLRYTDEHEWVRADGELVTIGITDFAQDQLGDVVYLELPEVGAVVESGGQLAEIESVKTVSDLFAPVSGEVVEVNETLLQQPELVNQAPYGDGWIARIHASDLDELDALLDAAAYRALISDS